MPAFSFRGEHKAKKKHTEGLHKYEIYMIVTIVSFAVILMMASFTKNCEPEREDIIEPTAIPEIVEMPSEREKTASEAILERDNTENDIILEEIEPTLEPVIENTEVVVQPVVENVPYEAPAYVPETVEPVVSPDVDDILEPETVVEEEILEEPSAEIVEEPEVLSTATGYSELDIMSVTNMVYGEISIVVYDQNMSEEEKDQVLQEWACVPVNHLKMGLASNLHELMSKSTSGGYYIWHPKYGTEQYRDRAMNEDLRRYQRCRDNVVKALDGRMSSPLPGNVIYADLAIHGNGAYKQYHLNTGYYQATVYLSFA